MRISQYKISLGWQYITAKQMHGDHCILNTDPYGPCGWCDIKCDDGDMDLSEEIKLYKNALKKANKRK
jgi:hypothetical protein